MRVLLRDNDGSLRVVWAICVEYDSDAQVCRVVLERCLFYVVHHVSQYEYDRVVKELYEKGFSSLANYESKSVVY